MLTSMRRWPLLASIALSVLICVSSNGCTRVSTSSNPSRSQTIPGTLRYAILGVESLNPLTQTTTDEVILDMYLYGWFFSVDDKGNFVPDLALEVPTLENGGISKDGLTLTYHLRHGVRWQDGVPFTARDVVATVHAIMNPKNDVFSRTGWDDIVSIETPDDFTVRFHLRKAYAPAIATFFCAYQHSGYPVLAAHQIDRYPDLNHVASLIGTGPFSLKEWARGDHIEFVANPLYWRGPPKLQRIIVKIIPDTNTILLQYKTHEIDALFNPPSAQYPQLVQLSDSKITLVPTPAFDLLAMNTRKPPLDDVRVRKAINLAIDKKRIISDVMHDVAMTALSDISSASWAYDPSISAPSYDPAAARALLDRAGWLPGMDGIRTKTGQRLTIDITTIAKDGDRTADELLIQDALRAIGVEAEVKNYPAELVYGMASEGGVLAGGHYDVAVVGQDTGIDPDDSTLLMCDQIPPAGVNWYFWCDKAFDDAERGALANYDQVVRKRYYAITQRELIAQMPVSILYYSRLIIVTRPQVHGIAPTPAEIWNWNPWAWSVD
jgi:peptide/nickel transport system substrate-binding protein